MSQDVTKRHDVNPEMNPAGAVKPATEVNEVDLWTKWIMAKASKTLAINMYLKN